LDLHRGLLTFISLKDNATLGIIEGVSGEDLRFFCYFNGEAASCTIMGEPVTPQPVSTKTRRPTMAAQSLEVDSRTADAVFSPNAAFSPGGRSVSNLISRFQESSERSPLLLHGHYGECAESDGIHDCPRQQATRSAEFEDAVSKVSKVTGRTRSSPITKDTHTTPAQTPEQPPPLVEFLKSQLST